MKHSGKIKRRAVAEVSLPPPGAIIASWADSATALT